MPRHMESSAVPMLRTGHLLALCCALRDTGAPADRYLNKHGLPLHCEQRDGFVPIVRVWSFLHDVARKEDALFGWHCGAVAGDRPISQKVLDILENASTLYQALLKFTRLVNTEATQLQLNLFGRGPDILVCVGYPGMQDIPGHAVAQAYQLEVILDLIRHYLGPHWTPAEIGVECSAVLPDIVDLHPNTRIVTGQRCGYIAIPRTLLYRSVTETPPNAPGGSGEAIQTAFGFVEALRGMLHAYLPDGYPSAQFAADLIGTSERTLERRLAQHGTSYGEVVDRIRFDTARQLLGQHDRHIRDIAHAVGFTDQRNFARMFRRISGLSPREYRKTLSTPS